MRVDLISDIHLEFGDLTLPGGDILIISGDACEARYLDKSAYGPDSVHFAFEDPRRKTGRFYRFFEEECRKYRKTIMVMGNHEHYGGRFDKTYDQIKNNLPDHVQLMEKETVEIDGVLFIGATLWTDCNKGDGLTMFHLKNSMSDYRVITMKNGSIYHKLTPERTGEEHMRTKEYIEQVLRNNQEREVSLPVVVVTHMAPSKLSIKPMYENDTLMNGGYSSQLDDFILDHPQIRLWTHGHTHEDFDYQIGSTRILCNPRGYVNYEERADTWRLKTVEV
jgi:Icc-related predicted phosphoesterase